MNKITVLVKEPDRRCRPVMIENKLKSFKELVGGYIEVFRWQPDRGIIGICNEEGKLLNLEPNISTDADLICGTVIFCGVDGEEFSDFPFNPYEDPEWALAMEQPL